VSVIRYYIDEDAAEKRLVAGLRSAGLDVVTVGEAGLLSAPDEDQLRFAAREGRTLFSFNVSDFMRLHQEYVRNGETHSGIAVITGQRYSIGQRVRLLIELTKQFSADEMVDRIEFLG
jgi:hypothetical protein